MPYFLTQERPHRNNFPLDATQLPAYVTSNLYLYQCNNLNSMSVTCYLGP